MASGPGGERIDVTQRALTLPGIETFPPPAHTAQSAATLLVFPTSEESETDDLPESIARDGNCLKGLGFALGLEAGAALCVYGAWQLWQILR